MKKSLLSVISILMVLPLWAAEQDCLVVVPIVGEEVARALENIQRIEFNGDQMTVVQTDKNQDTYSVEEVKVIKFAMSIPTSVEEQAAVAQVSIYPNPVTSQLVITGLQGDATVVLYDLTAKVVLQQTVSIDDNILTVASLAKGQYILKIGNVAYKIIKQ